MCFIVSVVIVFVIHELHSVHFVFCISEKFTDNKTIVVYS